MNQQDRNAADESRALTVEQRLAEHGLHLPDVPPVRGGYAPYRRVGNLVYLSGQGPAFLNSAPSHGKVGQDLTVSQGNDAAARTALSLLSVLKLACEQDLAKVKQCVKLTGYVNSAPGFVQQPTVIDGATRVLFFAFGEPGLPARAAIAVSDLPFNLAVELDAIFEVENEPSISPAR